MADRHCFSAMAFLLNNKNLIHSRTFPHPPLLLLLLYLQWCCVCRVASCVLLLTPRLSCHAQRFEAGELPFITENGRIKICTLSPSECVRLYACAPSFGLNLFIYLHSFIYTYLNVTSSCCCCFDGTRGRVAVTSSLLLLLLRHARAGGGQAILDSRGGSPRRTWASSTLAGTEDYSGARGSLGEDLRRKVRRPQVHSTSSHFRLCTP